MMKQAITARDAGVLTWFQTVQVERYRVHGAAPSALSGVTDASALLSGTLKSIVTRILPTR